MTETIEFYRSSGEYGWMSNLYPCQVLFEGKAFPTAEHAYQFGKFKDKSTADWAMQAPKPHLLAQLSHSLLPYDVVKDWNDIKVQRMRDVVLAKFRQNDDLKVKMLATGDAILVEKSKTDSFWGVGKNGKGKNMLGQILMETREKLKQGDIL